MIGYNAAFGWMSIGCLFLLPLLLVMRSAKPQCGTVIEVQGD